MQLVKITLALAGLLAATAVLIGQTVPADEPIPPRKIGLATMNPLDDWTPPPVHPETSDPGEGGAEPAAHPEAPPVIPHAVSDFLPIDREENLCLECHQIELEVVEEGDPTPLPPSHYVDLRSGSQEPSEIVVGSRWVCLSCHVERTDAAPLVENPFHTE